MHAAPHARCTACTLARAPPARAGDRRRGGAAARAGALPRCACNRPAPHAHHATRLQLTLQHPATPCNTLHYQPTSSPRTCCSPGRNPRPAGGPTPGPTPSSSSTSASRASSSRPTAARSSTPTGPAPNRTSAPTPNPAHRPQTQRTDPKRTDPSAPTPAHAPQRTNPKRTDRPRRTGPAHRPQPRDQVGRHQVLLAARAVRPAARARLRAGAAHGPLGARRRALHPVGGLPPLRRRPHRRRHAAAAHPLGCPRLDGLQRLGAGEAAGHAVHAPCVPCTRRARAMHAPCTCHARAVHAPCTRPGRR